MTGFFWDIDGNKIPEFPSLGPLVESWISQHCVIPDRFNAGDPWVSYDWQAWVTLNHYRVKPEAKIGQLASAFHYRRSLVIGPQKSGKGPGAATWTLNEAVGPAVFWGWAGGGEKYRCADWGCSCGWWYKYEHGEPMARPWPMPLIQLTASSSDQVANVYDPLKSMVKQGPLSELLRVGEEFTRIGDQGRIDAVTSSALSRLGNPVSFVLMDETGTWNDVNKLRKVATTQRRGLAGMGGRAIETTNAPDPSEDSVAQRTLESKATDIFRFWREPPKHLSWKNKAERRKILVYVYKGSDHIDIDAIEAEAAEIAETDPSQAERFFGNRMVYGAGAWADIEKWDAKAEPREVPEGIEVVVGFDGSDVDDHTAIRCETKEGYQFTPTFSDGRPMIWNPAEHGGQVPRLEVAAAIDRVFAQYRVVRMYADPPWWETEIDEWAAKYGETVVLRWATYRPVQMHAAAERLLTDINKADSTFRHDGCSLTQVHVRNARKAPRPAERYVLAKPSQSQKIDACVTSVICHEAAGDATAAGLWTTTYAVYMA
ncbi:hypothetical protein [Pseudonocardia sp. NPDC049154]|uniref:hypothetical protein n=1 Tax=Pseudonocardia sp. NPDC049154 TaxID=3155501 RepID=UPI0033D6D45F